MAALLGGLVGYAFANKVDRKVAENLMQALDSGGLLLWVRTPDVELEEKATAILRKHGAGHIHVHELKAPGPRRVPLPKFLAEEHFERL